MCPVSILGAAIGNTESVVSVYFEPDKGVVSGDLDHEGCTVPKPFLGCRRVGACEGKWSTCGINRRVLAVTEWPF